MMACGRTETGCSRAIDLTERPASECISAPSTSIQSPKTIRPQIFQCFQFLRTSISLFSEFTNCRFPFSRQAMASTRTVHIRGCSKGGLGDALARAFKVKGYRVIATARNASKIAHYQSLGIETLGLDVLSSDSISQCVAAVSTSTVESTS
jgi:hypothetical protein